MIFRQLFEPESSTYTYLFGCRDTGVAILLDPVIETVERDLALIQQLGLRLASVPEEDRHRGACEPACYRTVPPRLPGCRQHR